MNVNYEFSAKKSIKKQKEKLGNYFVNGVV